jgi:hypothetical protein
MCRPSDALLGDQRRSYRNNGGSSHRDRQGVADKKGAAQEAMTTCVCRRVAMFASRAV